MSEQTDIIFQNFKRQLASIQWDNGYMARDRVNKILYFEPGRIPKAQDEIDTWRDQLAAKGWTLHVLPFVEKAPFEED